MNSRLMLQKQRLQHYQTRIGYLSPENLIRDKRMYLLKTEEKLQYLMEQKIQKERHRLGIYIERMKGLSPLQKLNQGFSYVEGKDRKAVTKVEQAKVGEVLNFYVSDGQIQAKVEKTEAGADLWGKR